MKKDLFLRWLSRVLCSGVLFVETVHQMGVHEDYLRENILILIPVAFLMVGLMVKLFYETAQIDW